MIVPAMAPMLDAMGKVRAALLEVMAAEPGLDNCHLACGPEAPRQPTTEEEVDVARRAICEAIGVTDPAKIAGLRHPASPLRHGLFRALTVATEDVDTHPARWLRRGAPLGVEAVIPVGGHFPAKDDPPRLRSTGLRARQRSAIITRASASRRRMAPSRPSTS